MEEKKLWSKFFMAGFSILLTIVVVFYEPAEVYTDQTCYAKSCEIDEMDCICCDETIPTGPNDPLKCIPCDHHTCPPPF
jgi:hypothetical protein